VRGDRRGTCARRRFADLLDFCKRVDSSKLNRRALEALVKRGALDALGPQPRSLMLQLPEVLKATDQLAREREGRPGVAVRRDAGSARAASHAARSGRVALLQKLQGERETLGHYLSGHPLDPYREELRALVGPRPQRP
jgi:DNA polymerase-3 subunit alpha